jgi:hypothetical protein
MKNYKEDLVLVLIALDAAENFDHVPDEQEDIEYYIVDIAPSTLRDNYLKGTIVKALDKYKGSSYSNMRDALKDISEDFVLNN